MAGKLDISQISLLDIGSVVTGGAIAAVHVRFALPDPHGLPAWCWGAILLGWLTLTAAGPFFYVTRRFALAKGVAYPQVGDCLWLIWGCPWIVAAVIKAARYFPTPEPGQLDQAYVGSLGLGLFLATMIALPTLVARWLWGGPILGWRSSGWTQWVGLGLTATWPLQCGVGLVLMG